ncbi:MAG: NAD(+) diphosphatase [Oscillospiraceae bacterium]|jgi:NAD+ diphosphatase
MKHCVECGTKLEAKELEGEGWVPFCSTCDAFRFPIFNVAVSAEILNPQKDKILLIQQYGKKRYILVAGFVNKGESAEHALVREVKEEMGLDVGEYRFLKSAYFPKSNTLIFNFVCVATSEDLGGMTKEVDMSEWFSFAEAKKRISEGNLEEGTLAEKLVNLFLDTYSPEDHFCSYTGVEF